MPQDQLSHWLIAGITLRDKSDLSGRTLYLTNKPAIHPDVNSYPYYPILLGGVRIGTSSDREMILPESGSIRVDNSIGSFGVDRKLSDILERYEIIGQGIVFSSGTSEVDDTIPDGSTTFTRGTFTILSWSHVADSTEPAIEIRFDSKTFPKRVITRKIDSASFATAPLSAIGKSLPIVFGEDIQVRPVRVSPLTDDSYISYAYATTLSDQFVTGGIQTYYAQAKSGQYVEVANAPDANTAVFSTAATGTPAPLGTSGTEFATIFRVAGEPKYIITNVDLKFDGNAAATTYDGTLEVAIYEHTTLGSSGAIVPGDVVARASVEVFDYTSDLNGSSDFYIPFELDRPIVPDFAKAYFIGIRHVRNSAPGTVVVLGDTTGSGHTLMLKFSGEGWLATSGSPYSFNIDAFGVEFQDGFASINDDNGNASVFMTGLKRTKPSSAEDCKIGSLNLIFGINGLLDDSSGTITGTPSAQITTVHHAIKLMSQNYTGSVWTSNSGFDFTTFSSTYFPTNVIAGTTDGETTFEQWLREVCRNTATKVVALNGGAVAPYSWGARLTSAATFTQENSKIIRMGALDPSYVLNRVTIAYARALIYLDSIVAANQGLSSDYTGILNLNADTSAEYLDIIGTSQDIYGARELAEVFFNWINTTDAATRVARYLLTTFNAPPKYVEIEIPLTEFGELEVTNVVTIIHPSLPNYYGGIPNAKLPHYLGDTADDFNAGYNLCEAQHFRAQIEGKSISFNEDSPPTATLTCRLLINEHEPT